MPSCLSLHTKEKTDKGSYCTMNAQPYNRASKHHVLRAVSSLGSLLLLLFLGALQAVCIAAQI